MKQIHFIIAIIIIIEPLELNIEGKSIESHTHSKQYNPDISSFAKNKIAIIPTHGVK